MHGIDGGATVAYWAIMADPWLGPWLTVSGVAACGVANRSVTPEGSLCLAQRIGRTKANLV